MQIGANGPRDNVTKGSISGSGVKGQGHDAEVRFGGLAEASFPIPSVE